MERFVRNRDLRLILTSEKNKTKTKLRMKQVKKDKFDLFPVLLLIISN